MIWFFILLIILYLIAVYVIIRAFYTINQETDWDFKDKQVKIMYKNVRLHEGSKK